MGRKFSQVEICFCRRGLSADKKNKFSIFHKLFLNSKLILKYLNNTFLIVKKNLLNYNKIIVIEYYLYIFKNNFCQHYFFVNTDPMLTKNSHFIILLWYCINKLL